MLSTHKLFSFTHAALSQGAITVGKSHQDTDHKRSLCGKVL